MSIISKNRRKKIITKTRKKMKRKIAKKMNSKDLTRVERELEYFPIKPTSEVLGEVDL